jgi:hypothetical protein
MNHVPTTQLAGCCFGCGTATDSGLILEGLAEEIAYGLGRLNGGDYTAGTDLVLEYASDSYGCQYGNVPDEPITLDCHACQWRADRAGMVTALRLPSAKLPRHRLDRF